jgi:hypothetical protein
VRLPLLRLRRWPVLVSSPNDHVPRVTLARIEQWTMREIERIAHAEGCSGKAAAERLLARLEAREAAVPERA